MTHDSLTEEFEGNRDHLRAVAYRMLGSADEADDAVQETWLRLDRTRASGVDNLGGWLTTVVSRICLDMLRSRGSRREAPLEKVAEAGAAAEHRGPEGEAVLADSVGSALLIVLDSLEPAERLAFVLHDLFAVPFDEIGPIVGRTPTAARQLASRARRRVRGVKRGDPAGLTSAASRKQEIVGAFLAASRNGDFAALLALLDPDAVVRPDATAAAMGGSAFISGQEGVANRFAGGAKVARLAVIDGDVGWVWTQGGKLRVVFEFTVEDDVITQITLHADPDYLGSVGWTPLLG